VRSKINSFTLMETAVVLLVSGILVTVLFKLFLFVFEFRNKQMLNSNEVTYSALSRSQLVLERKLGFEKSGESLPISKTVCFKDHCNYYFVLQNSLEEDTILISNQLAEVDKSNLLELLEEHVY